MSIPSLGLGYTCRKGLKPESPNQDSWMILKVEEAFSMYGVFDGHGQKGHDISNYTKENLPKLIIKDTRFKEDGIPQIGAIMKDAFRKVQDMIASLDRDSVLDANLSGTTCTMAFHYHTAEYNRVTIAHVADSSCVLGIACQEADGKAGNKAERLTRDHKPDLKDEKARIEKAGGRVQFDGYANHRIYAKNNKYPGLNMSRCLGDLAGHRECGLSCEPEINEFDIKPEHQTLLLCSDGVWEFISPTVAVLQVAQYHPTKAMVAAEALAKEAWDRWIMEEGGAVVDDITVVMVNLHQAQKAAASLSN
jgi:serine/threonine protein phosphatase PrpC